MATLGVAAFEADSDLFFDACDLFGGLPPVGGDLDLPMDHLDSTFGAAARDDGLAKGALPCSVSTKGPNCGPCLTAPVAMAQTAEDVPMLYLDAADRCPSAASWGLGSTHSSNTTVHTHGLVGPLPGLDSDVDAASSRDGEVSGMAKAARGSTGSEATEDMPGQRMCEDEHNSFPAHSAPRPAPLAADPGSSTSMDSCAFFMPPPAPGSSSGSPVLQVTEAGQLQQQSHHQPQQQQHSQPTQQLSSPQPLRPHASSIFRSSSYVAPSSYSAGKGLHSASPRYSHADVLDASALDIGEFAGGGVPMHRRGRSFSFDEGSALARQQQQQAQAQQQQWLAQGHGQLLAPQLPPSASELELLEDPEEPLGLGLGHSFSHGLGLGLGFGLGDGGVGHSFGSFTSPPLATAPASCASAAVSTMLAVPGKPAAISRTMSASFAQPGPSALLGVMPAWGSAAAAAAAMPLAVPAPKRKAGGDAQPSPKKPAGQQQAAPLLSQQQQQQQQQPKSTTAGQSSKPSTPKKPRAPASGASAAAAFPPAPTAGPGSASAWASSQPEVSAPAAMPSWQPVPGELGYSAASMLALPSPPSGMKTVRSMPNLEAHASYMHVYDTGSRPPPVQLSNALLGSSAPTSSQFLGYAGGMPTEAPDADGSQGLPPPTSFFAQPYSFYGSRGGMSFSGSLPTIAEAGRAKPIGAAGAATTAVPASGPSGSSVAAAPGKRSMPCPLPAAAATGTVPRPLVPKAKKRASPNGQPPKAPAPNPNGHCCTHCGTQTTPVWRAGPQGPKTLCNACGVRYMKVAKKK